MIATDPALREFCREGLPWAGCTTDFAADIADAVSSEFYPDVIVVDLPANGTHSLRLQQLREHAAALGCTLIALTDDLDLIRREPAAGLQILFRPCPAETLWDALAIAVDERR